MIKNIFGLSVLLFSLTANAMTFNCTGDEDFITSTFGALKSSAIPLNIEDPEGDAIVRAGLNDFRLFKYGEYQGYVVPGLSEKNKNIACSIGLRTIDGITDSYEGAEHLKLASRYKVYATKYNSSILSIVKSQLK